MGSDFIPMPRKGLTGGINRLNDPNELKDNELYVGNNVQFRKGILSKIGGWKKLSSTVSGMTSLIKPMRIGESEISVICASGGLYTVNADLSVTLFQATTALTTEDWRVDYMAGSVYFLTPSVGLLKWSGTGGCTPVVVPNGYLGRELCQYANHLLMGRLAPGTTDGPLSFVGSGLSNATDWDTGNTASDADLVALTSSGDPVQRIMRGGQFAYVYKEKSIHQISYRGLPDVYSVIGRTVTNGLPAANAIVELAPSGADGQHVFAGIDNLYVLAGGNPNAIGDRVFKYWSSLINSVNRDKTYCFHHLKQKEIWFVFAKGAGDQDTALVWNYEYNAFSTRDCPFIALGYVRSPTVNADSAPFIDEVNVLMSTGDPKADVIYKNQSVNTVNLEDYKLIGAKSDGTLYLLEGTDDDGRAETTNIVATWQTGTCDFGDLLEGMRKVRYTNTRIGLGGLRIDCPSMTGAPLKFYVSQRMSLAEPIKFQGPYLFRGGEGTRFTHAGRHFDFQFVKDNGQISMLSFAPLVKEIT